MSLSSPDARSSPILDTTKAAVEPVPSPRTIPELTYSTALSAASFLRSSWVSGWTGDGAEKALMERYRGELKVTRRVEVAIAALLWWRRREEERGGRERREREAMVDGKG